GEVSTSLGLKGMPRIAEEVAVRKNLELLGYAGGRLHFSKLSTAKSIEMVRAAKKKGMNLSCDVAAYQPLMDDGLLVDFDTNYKLNPPLRERNDNEAIIKGLIDGTIDVLVSGHLPQDDESKQVEFDHADFGLINLQTFASHLTSLAKSVDTAELIYKVTVAPRQILKLDVPFIEEDTKANLTLFDPNAEWTFDAASNLSKSKNSPWLGKALKGKAIAVFNNGKMKIEE
ncbi:MAG: dihydroorotase, partial [Cytophagales bacterium]